MENQSPSDEQKKRRTIKMRCWLFLTLNVLITILIILTVNYIVKDTNCEIIRETRICVNCSDLVIHPDDTIETVHKMSDGTCCVAAGQNVYDLVHLYTSRWLKNNLAERNASFHRFKCGSENERHTIKIVGQQKRQEKMHHNKVLWDSDSKMAVIPDAKYMTHHPEHGFIEIKRTGLFFVYSQLVLEHDGPGNVDEYNNGLISYQHSISLITAGSDQIHARSILLNKDTRCSCTKDKYRFTSQLGSAFQLNKGDKLFVRVSNVTEIVPDPVMNHFGVHRL
ncbi:tumor necrosis factor (ligand) superfamily [Mactra antiquata]